MKSQKNPAPLRPRNPLVAAAKLRHAGSHRPSNQSIRAQHKRDTRRAIQRNDEFFADAFAFVVPTDSAHECTCRNAAA